MNTKILITVVILLVLLIGGYFVMKIFSTDLFGNKNDQADLTEYNKIKVYTDDDRRIHIGDIILKDKGELDLLIIVKGGLS
ncbi:hypothetical protein KKC67_01205 [Patescibacteria group bacterium]|nr:hypothetical protein [Patescibacteria group bacterium]MBU0880533.1 hypothetical protein [Patescibacteria group bacterium]MBU0897686.1 hypothetical protein [Patescibacteria group bacterium]MBU1783326.1 hypothetical protein [Patescibacteria group bacterium]MBU1991615.1 hypothetical protein [Patescibacteria group bacterium]